MLEAVNQPIARTSTTESDTSAPMVIPSTTASGTGPIGWRLGLQAIRIAAFRPSIWFVLAGDIFARRARSAMLASIHQITANGRSILPQLGFADKREPLPLGRNASDSAPPHSDQPTSIIRTVIELRGSGIWVQ